MGAIVLNKIIRDFGDRLPISNIVYMAAACSIRDYQDTVWPYLKHPRNRNVQFYNLMLHPKAEAQDSVPLPVIGEYVNPVPRGSLLVWLDGFLTNPASPLDTTAGRFTNFVRTVDDTPAEVKGQIHLKVFRKGYLGLFRGKGKIPDPPDPQRHGGFGEHLKFWKTECLQLDKENTAACWH
jgi:hypothetical protein